MTKDDEVVYKIYSNWIDNVSRITFVWRNELERSPKWVDSTIPPPVDICNAIRIASEAIKLHFDADPSEFDRMRITLQTIDPDMCFWFLDFIQSERPYHRSLSIGVLMDGHALIPIPERDATDAASVVDHNQLP